MPFSTTSEQKQRSVRSPEPEAESSKSSKGSSIQTAHADDSQEELRDSPSVEIQDLVGPEEQRLLIVWYLRARDLSSQNPSVQDPFATALIDKIKLDLSRSEFKLDQTYVRYVSGRTKQIDEWTGQFLNRHQFEDSIVLQLTCGLDTRYLRVKGGRDVKWIDVERPRVAALRNRLIPTPEGDYELISAMIGEDDQSWLGRIPSDRPVLIIMESLLYYLEPEKGLRLLQRLLAHFRKGNIVCDTFGSVAVTFNSLIPPLKNAKSAVKWGIDDAEDLQKLDKRLVLRDRVYSHEYMSAGWFAKGYPPMFGGWTPLISLLPKFKKHGQFLHFEF
ncbi:hypothetical protein N0V82_000948 [Gnomoniopsis sp. IMI 355080]|nr:hypothetical protein N0V82_000948 [Gnomoniopsis sp. IMI 355080]